MPELPEVETVRQGLMPLVVGSRITKVTLKRENLRFPFAPDFTTRLTGTKVNSIGRRAKYLLFALSSDDTLLAHLGMTGNFRFALPNADGNFQKHDHVIFELASHEPGNQTAPDREAGALRYLIYSDPRRFGFMEIFSDEKDCAFINGLGPEPLGNQFSALHLAEQFATRKAPVKNLLLDQKIVAGLGNIYVCEALFDAGINPQTPGSELVTDSGGPSAKLTALTETVQDVLRAALKAGGSTLKDYRNVEGESGYFQHQFSVYGREGDGCRKATCNGMIARKVQAGRSTFYCPQCQP